MPAPRGAATFEPIPPDLDLNFLVEDSSNFQYAPRISCDQIDKQGLDQFEKLVQLHVIQRGQPLVVEGFHNRLDRWTFSPQWLRNNKGQKFEHARDLTKKENLPLSISHYLDNMSMLANQWTPTNYRLSKQRLYLKDIDCPEVWIEKLREHIPSVLFYLNDNTGEVGGPGAAVERNMSGMAARKKELGIAGAGDLMSSLPANMRAENMMCYIGHEGTYTPAHREMCASLGQNIMVEASGTMGEDGKATKPGSSIWFMTESQDRHLVSEYWLSTLGHDIEVESHFAQIMAWKKAPFKVYIVEQKVGDLILIPPLAPHQVWNRGTRTMKAAWNRTTVDTLEMALNEALPRARMVCRDEQYKNKAIILYTLTRYSGLLGVVQHQREVARDQDTYDLLTKGKKIRQLFKDFKKLFGLYHAILVSETFILKQPERNVEFVQAEGNVMCSYCRCNIFNRFLTCKHCLIPLEDGEEDTYDICMECYVMGRSCSCISKLSWAEQYQWKDLVQKHHIWRNQIFRFGGDHTLNVPPPFEEALESTSIKSLAQICQEQLKARPFKDPSKEQEPEGINGGSESGSDGVNADDTPRKTPKKRQTEKWMREHQRCHLCSHHHAKWKMAICDCGTGYCYGSLWRAFDLMPQTIFQDRSWTCPRCQKICNCSKCRRDPLNSSYEPSATIIGHNTRKFADPRSVEALVDFSCSNTHWLKKAGDDEHPTETRRLLRRIYEAEQAKTDLSDGEPDEEPEQPSDPRANGIPIDPLLMGEVDANREPDDENVEEGNDTMRTARDALSALERNPQAFLAKAGLDGSRMIVETAENGISYEYPDPNAFLRDFQAPMMEKGHVKTGAKRKRNDYKQKLEDDAAVFADDANRKFYMSQTQKAMTEAKKTGRLISAQAALTGASLVVRLKISSERLAGLRSPMEAAFPTLARDDDVATANVQSDLPKTADPTARALHSPRKRLRVEADGDFSTRKRDRTKNQAARQAEEEDSSDASSSQNDIAPEAPASRSEPKRRSLPAYLARRSPVAEDEMPRELTATEPRRSSGATTKKSSNLLSTSIPPKPGPAPIAHMQPILNGNSAATKLAAGKQADLNRRAKLRAIQGKVSDASSESESDDNVPNRNATLKSASKTATPETKSPVGSMSTPGSGKKRGRPPKRDGITREMVKAKEAVLEVRKSIFSKRGRGKIRIVSARNA